MQVELYLEDNFFQLSQEKTQTDISVISTETWENWFSSWLSLLQPELPTAECYEIGLRLTDDREIQQLNAQYRQQNKPTDVLSFAALEVNSPLPLDIISQGPLYLGDIVVSVDTAIKQAQQQEHSLQTELAWLTAHGLLHLLGWDHPDAESELRMLKQQVTLLKTIGIAIDLEYY